MISQAVKKKDNIYVLYVPDKMWEKENYLKSIIR